MYQKPLQTILNLKIYPHINRTEKDGKACVKVRFKGNDIPYFAYGRARISDMFNAKERGISQG
jgi:hypothetical protein